MNKGSIRARLLIGLGAVAIVAAACSSSGASTAPSAGGSAAAGGNVIVGISNPGAVGNGWREAMICSAKAQAVKNGNVASVLATTRVTDAAGQLADIRDLIAKNVNILLINPSSPDALNPAIAEAIAKGIAVVAIDAPVTAPGAYNLSNDQVQYAYLGAKALFEQMGKKGDVIYMRGIAGHQADTDRDTGFKKALAEYPDIKVAKETVTKWDQKIAVDQINDILTSGLKFDGIWTSGIDNVIVDALKTAKHPLVPVIGADNAGFVKQLINEAGLKGAAVTNPAAVGGAGVVLGQQILDKKAPADPNVHVTPELWDNTTEEGKAALAAANDETLPAIWPLGLTVKDWTTYEKDAVKACKGPGES
jgi:ribose transport system substrate-binding protein